MEHYGREREPIVVIDNALSDPERLVADARLKHFTPIGPYFPGIRATTSAEFTQSLGASIRGFVSDCLELDHDRWAGECFYSMVTTPPEKLLPIQRLPHFDGVENDGIAVLCYLCKPAFGGTSFYRHRATGFETIDAERSSIYHKTLQSEVAAIGLPPAQYMDDGAPVFDRIGTIEAAFNRMLIYRGVNLHSGRILSPSLLSDDPDEGRLTINAFLAPDTT